VNVFFAAQNLLTINMLYMLGGSNINSIVWSVTDNFKRS